MVGQSGKPYTNGGEDPMKIISVKKLQISDGHETPVGAHDAP
jgi:hypothetical protein